LIHWKGYPIEDATWEPENHVGDGAIETYEREKKSKKEAELRALEGLKAPSTYVSPYAQPAAAGEKGVLRAPRAMLAPMQRGQVVDDEDDDHEVDLL
jgi:hypothetical protein